MQVILLERIEKLGQMGDVVTVRPGFARNFLLPQKKAMRATQDNLHYFEREKSQLEAVNLERRTEAEQVGEKLEGLIVSIIRNAGDSGQLYGSVNSRDIADAVSEAGFTVARNQVLMERPLKMLGLHDYRIRLHPEVAVTVTINVAQSAEEAEMQEQLGQAIIPSEGGEYEEEEEAQALATADIMDPPPTAAEEADGESSDMPSAEALVEEPTV
ncbi:MAG: 50S ribosomal protein L9 [Rhodospirillaceae bacterium]|nr:50S ribosomal protein L9 [Rhodospirillaceae bacterium]